VQVFVRPTNAETFHKHVALGFTAPEELFVVREGTANLSMELGELDVVEQPTSLDNVGEATEGVIKVLESRPK
jgi:hypothetical protein